ncbi:hypothetical protein FKP32DRAFT_135795 [Trametes sanguinea]|nr:hypothetical protein FKP32DRAFT_135795 [Trametes sanguinea]
MQELDHSSPRIYLSPNNPRQLWVVLLEQIRVWVGLTAEQSSDPLGTTTGFPPSAVVDFSAWPFVLDTGAACSYFPNTQLDSLITQLHLNQVDNVVGSYYSLPQPAPGQAMLDKGSLIEWTFMSQGAPVKVVSYATYFLRDKTGEGVIWPKTLGSISQPDERSNGILGLNFFRTVFAEFHYPRATDEVPSPYIRLARQDGRQLSVPPLSR